MSTPMETSEELLQPIESNEATENAQNDADILLEDLNDTQDPMEETKQMEESQKTLEALDQIPDIIEKLGQDNTQYELHIQLIDLLKQADLPEQLEDARWTMHDVYPLSENVEKKISIISFY
ncbi:hypothetical protein RMCBS344292_10400 [Rhizopus microsporus]|nr:hypothetical protein RMCBS344292_10400 [Rhizopus microsporus]